MLVARTVAESLRIAVELEGMAAGLAERQAVAEA